MADTNKAGRTYEAIARSRNHLLFTHVVLGLIGSFSVWTGSSAPHLNAFGRGAGWMMMILSILGWGPYLLSWLYSRSVLEGSRLGVVGFSIGAAGITAAAIGLYQRLFQIQTDIPKALVSAGVAVSLIALAKACSLVWSPLGQRDEQG